MLEQDEGKWKQSATITDARGRVVTQLDPVAMHLQHRHDLIGAELLEEIAWTVGIGLTWMIRIMFWLVAAGAVCFAITLAILISRLAGGSIDDGQFIISVLLFLGAWLVPLVIWITARHARRRRITIVMLLARRCPHCAHVLDGLPTSRPDGATMCPGCGCAWLL